MKLALITGPTGFDLVEKYGLGTHMILAQECLKDEAYLRHYMGWHDKGHFLILDNGAAEDEPVEFGAVLEIASLLDADEIALPDVLRNSIETLEKTLQWINEVPKRNRMVIPQGKNWAEWEICLKALVSAGCATIGVPKLYEGYDGGRAKALSIIEKYSYHLSHNVHLLGCFRKPVEEIRELYRTAPWIRSVDTAAPFAYAQRSLAFSMTDEHVSYKWNGEFSERYARENINQLLEVVRGL